MNGEADPASGPQGPAGQPHAIPDNGVRRLLVFISGPYSDPDPEQVARNVEFACAAAYLVLAAGHIPFIPHTMTGGFDRWYTDSIGDDFGYENYISWDDQVLRRCDALLTIGESPGANRERDQAFKLGIPIYDNVLHLPHVFHRPPPYPLGGG